MSVSSSSGSNYFNDSESSCNFDYKSSKSDSSSDDSKSRSNSESSEYYDESSSDYLELLASDGTEKLTDSDGSSKSHKTSHNNTDFRRKFDDLIIEYGLEYYNGENNFITRMKKYMDSMSYCKHYENKCRIYAECCNKEYFCSKCHDEDNINNHIINLNTISHIVCKLCDTPQIMSNECENCGLIFSTYYCEKCKIFDNNNMFHCNKCDVCLIGKEHIFKHCDKCKCCALFDFFDKHKCIKDKLENNCVICMDKLRSHDPLQVLVCGHVIHNECYDHHTKTSYKCPICFKTIIDTKKQFADIDDEILFTPLKNAKKIMVKCNDCDKISKTKYHYAGLKCQKCGSYNTYDNSN